MSNDAVGECFDRFWDIKNIKHIKDSDDIATGVREVVISMREGDQRYLPYFTSIEGNRILVTAPGRPPICFRCESVGHMRHECPNFVSTKSTGRSYATAIQTPAVSKPGQGAVGRPQVQGRREAVGKPPAEEPQNEVADHRGPQGEASTEISLQCGQVDHGGDTRSRSADIEMSADDDFDLADQRGDTEVSLPVPPSSIEEDEDDDNKFTLETRKRRKHDEPVSPSAAEPTRAQR